MGVPKFYRWISERYPCLSEVVKEFHIPNFDNLYLDMNGIIHTCSHPNDDDPHFRISEDNIFANICHYIEFLFKIIKPKKVFFMAVDGVAPRAKMNQQRGRRFRTAKATIMLEEKAKTHGEVLPADARFDSNCITPGTEFMAKLHSVLKKFVIFKVSSDKLWKNVRIYLSGHDVPGEGEHKIMDFIRYEKSQPQYNPNTRHCLYGLDADLIMLGLCSHEPFFSLLREEVKFGGKRNQKRIMAPEETTFHLLHISLLRDYLSHEFSPIKEKINFQFDVESIIDDFVLMSFLVGNDFIPHLPQLHIHHDALPVLFKTYMEVLPSLLGYINEQGILHLERFEIFLKKLAEYDFRRFEELNDDFQYLDSKSKMKESAAEEKIHSSDFLLDLGFSSMAINKMAELDSSSGTDDGKESSSDDDCCPMQLEFNMHKSDYYINKLEFDSVTAEVLKDQAEGYVRAIQWNLHYYYNGVVSWSWYYPHHYSPYISDIKNFKDMEMKFELGQPFLPFQQLLAVLPKFSKDLLPLSYQKLMCDEDSPLIDFYPNDFLTDLNGKQQEWEAIVLIPFINEKLLLKFSAIADKDLNEVERKRNSHGSHLLYRYDSKSSGPFPSFLPNYYPDLNHSNYKLQKIEPDYFRLPSNLIKKGLCEGVALDKIILGFPTLKSLKHSAELRNEKVKVFQMISQKENMMLTIKENELKNLDKLSGDIIGNTIYVGWPHVRESLAVGLSDGNYKSIKDTNKNIMESVFSKKELTPDEKDIWKKQVEGIKEHNYQRWGIFIGPVNVLVHVQNLVGIKLVWSKDGKMKEEKQWDANTSYVPLQTTLSKIDALSFSSEDISDYLSPNSVVFILVSPHYGDVGTILTVDVAKEIISVKITMTVEPELNSIIENQEHFITEQYKPGYIAAQQLGIDSFYLSRLTGTFLIQTSPKGSSSPNRVNIGLNLKFSRKNEEVQGFTKKKDNTWLYSEKAIKLLDSYLMQFPNFFEKLLKFVNEDIIYLEDLFPEEGGFSIVNKVTDWLKSQGLDKTERQVCGMEKLDKGIVAEIEQQIRLTNTDVRYVTKNFFLHQLYFPYLCKGITKETSNSSFRLFDRVMNINYSSCVPLGLRGTVIGIGPEQNDSDRMYEVIFDQEFFGGMSISCSSKKGYRLPAYSLLNLSSQAKTNNRTIAQTCQSSRFVNGPKQLKDNLILRSKPPSKPFYNVREIFHTTSPNKPTTYPSPLSESIDKMFVTPKADCSPSAFSSNKDNNHAFYQKDFWAELKRTPTEPTVLKVPMERSEIYGKKLTVQELFHSFETQNSRYHPITNKNFIEMLLHICLNHFNAPPSYTFHNHGQTNYYIATVSLPNGNKITSSPCNHKHDAALNAAEKAITFLGPSIPPSNNISAAHVGMFNRPPVPSIFSSCQSPQLPSVHGYPFLRSETSFMRHPSPAYHPANIMPDSFVASNQVFNHLSQSSPQSLISDHPLDTELFHMPGGGTAKMKNTKANKFVSEKMIIPAQVVKQAAKSPFDSSGSEWPELPSKCELKSKVIPKVDNSPALSEPKAVSSKVTATKKKRSRIAANFQNS